MPRNTNTVMSIVPCTCRNSESPPGTSAAGEVADEDLAVEEKDHEHEEE